MAEQLTLTTPIAETRTNYAIKTFTIARNLVTPANSTITIEVQDNLGNVVTNTYGPNTTPTGASLITQLNGANFTNTSLQKTILNRLKNDGFLPAGSVSGTPE